MPDPQTSPRLNITAGAITCTVCGVNLPGLGEHPCPAGAVHVELTVSGRWSVSHLVKGWSAEEKQALIDGDKEAWNALRDAASQQTLAAPDDVETEDVRVYASWKEPRHAS